MVLSLGIDSSYGYKATGGDWPLSWPNILYTIGMSSLVGFFAGFFAKRRGKLVGALAQFVRGYHRASRVVLHPTGRVRLWQDQPNTIFVFTSDARVCRDRIFMARDGISDFVFRLPGYREGSWLYHRVEKCMVPWPMTSCRNDVESLSLPARRTTLPVVIIGFVTTF